MATNASGPRAVLGQTHQLQRLEIINGPWWAHRRRGCATPLASWVQSIIVSAVTRDYAEGLQFHVLPTDDPLPALNILREAAGLQPLSDEHDDQGG
jgi:hypothetical protein